MSLLQLQSLYRTRDSNRWKQREREACGIGANIGQLDRRCSSHTSCLTVVEVSVAIEGKTHFKEDNRVTSVSVLDCYKMKCICLSYICPLLEPFINTEAALGNFPSWSLIPR